MINIFCNFFSDIRRYESSLLGLFTNFTKFRYLSLYCTVLYIKCVIFYIGMFRLALMPYSTAVNQIDRRLIDMQTDYYEKQITNRKFIPSKVGSYVPKSSKQFYNDDLTISKQSLVIKNVGIKQCTLIEVLMSVYLIVSHKFYTMSQQFNQS